MHEATPYLVALLNIVVGIVGAAFWFVFKRFVARIDNMEAHVTESIALLKTLESGNVERERNLSRVVNEMLEYRIKMDERMHGMSNFMMNILAEIRELRIRIEER